MYTRSCTTSGEYGREKETHTPAPSSNNMIFKFESVSLSESERYAYPYTGILTVAEEIASMMHGISWRERYIAYSIKRPRCRIPRRVIYYV